MIFDYFMLDMVPRDTVREANNNLLRKADELWVFGQISDGVAAEIALFEGSKKFFAIKGKEFIEVSQDDLEVE